VADPLTSAEGLKVGDVVSISTLLKDKKTGEPFRWNRFAVVLAEPDHAQSFVALTLKMHVSERDYRVVYLTRELTPSSDVVCKIEEENWPQGVVAMRMKLIMQGILQLGT